MTSSVEIPLWLFLLMVLFAAVTFASRFLFPSVRWFFRRRLERAVKELNKRLTRPIEPFKLARRHDMIQRIIYDPEVTRAIVTHAQQNDVPENVAFEQARRFAREIVPSFSAFAYFSLGARVARWLVNALYDVRTSAGNDATLQRIDPDAAVIFVMNHRSNMDYVLVTYLASRSSALSYAVGEWARVWPLSHLIKAMGAYFIRRKSRGQLYRKVLARYVQMAIQGGATQGIFPEGGLSVNGRLMHLKMGLLSYAVEGFDPETRDLVFVPVSINYDRVLEDRVLIAADKRGDRRFGARITVVMAAILSLLWNWMRRRYRKFGVASVAFGAPLSLSGLGSDVNIDTLADTLRSRISEVTPVLCVPLVSRVMLRVVGPINHTELGALVQDEMPSVAVRLSGEMPDVTRACKDMVRRGMIVKSEHGWSIVPEERALLQFYANSIAELYPDCPPLLNAACAKL